MASQDQFERILELFHRCRSKLAAVSTDKVWVDGIGLPLAYLTGSLAREPVPVPVQEIQRWESKNNVSLPEDFRRWLKEVGTGSLDLSAAGPLLPLSEIEADFDDSSDDPDEYGTAVEIANTWDGGDTNTVTLMLTGMAAGTLRFSERMNLPPGKTFSQFAEELLVRLDHILDLAEDCRPRLSQELRAKQLPEPARLAYCAALTERAMKAATRWWSDNPCPTPDQQEALTAAMTVLKLAARGGDIQSAEASRIHERVELLRQWSFKNRAVAPDCLEQMSKALAWSLVLAYPAGDSTAPSFNAFPRRNVPEPSVIESIPKYVLDAVDTVLGATSTDWRETNRREMAWRKDALDLLVDGKSLKDLPQPD